VEKKMTKKIKALIAAVGILVLGGLAHAIGPEEGPFSFAVSFSSEAQNRPVTGRVYVIISTSAAREPRFQVGPSGVPFWGKDVQGLQPGAEAVVDQHDFGFPLESIEGIPPGEYFVQAFCNIYTEFMRADGHTVWLHNDQWEGQRWNRSPGNLYSEVKKIDLDPEAGGIVRLVCDKVIPPVEIPEDTQWVKRIKFKSKILSDFWGQPIYLGATVLLPKGYHDNPGAAYPVNYSQGHFSLRAPFGFSESKPASGDRRAGRGYQFYEYWTSDQCPRFITVTFQHPCPYYDDSYAVDSANVGPYGEAIIKELIPAVEERFRAVSEPWARILSGGSTGGWEALALQIFYPDFFGGAFASCPDPVDFRYYQMVNIYRDSNAYFRQQGWHRVDIPSARSTDGSIRYTMRMENHAELAVGDRARSGGQWDIWQAVYGPVGPDGYPQPIWDKRTGFIDPEVAEYWKENYDLRHILERDWDELGPKLRGKLFIYAGDMDSFYLNNAVKLMEDFLKKTDNPPYDGVVAYGDGEPHCWGPRGAELLNLMAGQVTKNAPSEFKKTWLNR
jgi:hypothetical protein